MAGKFLTATSLVRIIVHTLFSLISKEVYTKI